MFSKQSQLIDGFGALTLVPRIGALSRVFWLAGILMLGVAIPARAESIVCDPSGSPCTHTRDLTVWFGTLTVVGAPAPNSDFLQLSDNINGTVANLIFIDPTVDARVRTVAGLGPFVNPLLSDIDWVAGALDNFNAQQNLLDAFTGEAGLLDATFGVGVLGIGSPLLSLGPVNYTLSTWIATGCGGTCSIQNIGDARVTYFEQDATWTAPTATAVPEPSSLLLLGCGILGGSRWWTRRRRTLR